MEKQLLPRKVTKQYSLNCKLGRYFTLADGQGYGKTTSATAKKAFPADARGIIRTKGHCRIKPLIH